MSHNSFPFPIEDVSEGSITLTIPKLTLFAKNTSEYIPSKAPVFYNPRMELSRDVAVLALRVYQKSMNRQLCVCDPMTGSGVRGLRFASEVNGVYRVVLNDIKLQAARLTRFNAKKCGLDQKVIIENMDARVLLVNHIYNKFDVIDLDPYGSPSPFLDYALAALRNRGLLALTATDTASLCGVSHKACIRKYFGKSLRTEYSHELALRLLINSIVFSAARADLGVDILFSHKTNHYIRVYAQLRRGAERANNTIKNIGYVVHCFNCLNRNYFLGLIPLFDIKCEICGSDMAVAGPLWLGKLVHEDFCKKMFEEANNTSFRTKKRLSRMLATIVQEFDTPPTYFMIDKVCKKLGLRTVSKDLLTKKLVNMGFKAVNTHFHPQGIKSDASILEIKKAVKAAIQVSE